MIPNSSYTYSTGWNLHNIHRGRINNYGYASPSDYEPGRGGIAVFGDSYVEAHDERLSRHAARFTSRLSEDAAQGDELRNVGCRDAGLSRHCARWCVTSFAPEWAVVVITLGDFMRGFSATPGYFEWAARSLATHHAHTGNSSLGAEQMVAHPGADPLPARQSVDAALRAHPVCVAAATPPRGTGQCQPEVLSKEDEASSTHSRANCQRRRRLPPGHVILVFDSDRKAIYAGKTGRTAAGCPQRATLANDRLKEIAAQDGTARDRQLSHIPAAF